MPRVHAVPRSHEPGRITRRSRALIEAHDLDEVGKPGERWDGADPAMLERVLFHLLQEYARHLGHLDYRHRASRWPFGRMKRIIPNGPSACP